MYLHKGLTKELEINISVFSVRNYVLKAKYHIFFPIKLINLSLESQNLLFFVVVVFLRAEKCVHWQ